MKKLYSLLLLGGLLFFGVQSVLATDYYIKNPWNTGNWTWQKMTSNGNGTYSYEGTYDGTSGCNWNTSNSDAGAKWCGTTSGENINLVIDDDVKSGWWCVFTLDPTANNGDGKITISLDMREVSVYVSSSKATHVYAWYHDNDSKTDYKYATGWPGNELSGSYSIGGKTWKKCTFNFPYKKYLNVIVNNSSAWQTADILLFDVERDHTLYFEVADDATYTKHSTIVCGDFNSWNGNDVFLDDEVTINLTAGATYEFKIYDGSSWYGVGDNAKNITWDNCTEWSLSGTNNLVISPTTTGNYIFKWEDSKLSVIYPTYPVGLSAAGPGGKGYATLFLPVAVTIPSGVSAYYQSGTDPTPLGENHTIDINFTKISGNQIPAETPVLLTGTASSAPSFAYYSNTVSPVSKGSLFKGVTKEGDLSDGLDYVDGDYLYLLANGTHGIGFYKMGMSGKVAASHCYLVIPSANSPLQAPTINMWLEDENGATALPFFTEENNVNENAVKFIEDGKLFIRKNGVVYDATGRIVR